MALGSWWLEFRLGRVERRLKKLHVQQRQLRGKIQEAETAHRRGELAPHEYEARVAKLQQEKQAVTDEVGALNHEAGNLRRQLKGTTA